MGFNNLTPFLQLQSILINLGMASTEHRHFNLPWPVISSSDSIMCEHANMAKVVSWNIKRILLKMLTWLLLGTTLKFKFFTPKAEILDKIEIQNRIWVPPAKSLDILSQNSRFFTPKAKVLNKIEMQNRILINIYESASKIEIRDRWIHSHISTYQF